MAFLGLGSFGTGLVTGLAESSNQALQESMDRIRRRIDTVSEYRVKKAISEQEERAAEVKEIEDLINQGSKLFKDNPRATEYAATLLDKYGVDGYKALIPKMQEAQFNNGLNISDYFDISQVSDITKDGVKPLTINDYAESYIGGNFKVPDYKLPPDAVPDSGLVGAIFGDIDISGRIQQQYESDVAAAGYDMDIEVPDVTLGDITFNKFKFDVDVAPTFDDKVNLYRQALLDETKSETEIMQLQSDYSSLLSVAANSRSYDTQIKALNMQLDRTTPGSEASQEIVFKINNIKTTRDLEIAEAQNDEESIFNLKAKSAWTKYKLNPNAQTLQDFTNIRNQQNKFLTGMGVPLTQQAEEIKLSMQGLDPNSNEYKVLENELKGLRVLNEAGIEVSTPEYDAAQNLVNKNAELLAIESGSPILMDPEYIAAKDLLEKGTFTIEQLRQSEPLAYNAYAKATTLLQSNRKEAWQQLIKESPNDRGLIAYGNVKGYITQPSTTVTPTDDITATVPADATDVNTQTDELLNDSAVVDDAVVDDDTALDLVPETLADLGFVTTEDMRNDPEGAIEAMLKLNPKFKESKAGLDEIVNKAYLAGIPIPKVTEILRPYRSALDIVEEKPETEVSYISDESA